jgi:hypothetical protein
VAKPTPFAVLLLREAWPFVVVLLAVVAIFGVLALWAPWWLTAAMGGGSVLVLLFGFLARRRRDALEDLDD